MKVTKVNAFKSNDDSLYATEQEAINDNIDMAIDLIDHSCEGSSNLRQEIRDWFRNYPKEIRYIQSTIKKVDDPTEE
jgi:hypothetical protein